MSGFEGFPLQNERSVSVPEAFFTRLAPQIRSVTELKVTLHLMWVLSQRLGLPRCIEYVELASDEAFLSSLKASDGPRPAEDYLREGLELSVTRGTALQVQLKRDAGREVWYFLNTAASRDAVARLQSGEAGTPGKLRPGQEGWIDILGDQPIREVKVYRPNVYALYEQNIGSLTPIIAERLRLAETQYPAAWLEDGIRMAVEYNKRSWRYVEAILQRWQVEGKDEGRDHANGQDDSDQFSYFRSKYQHIYK